MEQRMMLRLSGVLVCVLLLGRPAVAEELRPQLDDLVEHFTQVALGQEYADLGGVSGILAKWGANPVAITVQGRPTQELAAMASKHLNEISRLTGVRFKQVTPGTNVPSIDLIFLKRAQMGAIKGPNIDPKAIQSLASDPTMACFFLKWHKPADQIVKAIVVVNIELEPVRVDSCLLEELTQVMGLPNDVKAYWKTLFNPLDVSFTYSEWDALYLKTLYDPRLKPGMNAEAVRATVRPIFAEALSKAPKSP